MCGSRGPRRRSPSWCMLTGRSDWTRSRSSSTMSGRSPTRGSCWRRRSPQRLGIEALVDECVDLGDRPGAANAGAKVMTLVSAMALGADCIDDCDVLRAGRTGAGARPPGRGAVDAGDVPAAFTFGHVRQLDRVLADDARACVACRAPVRATSGWSSMSTRSSARSSAAPSRAPRSATPASAATTRCSPRAPTPARSCTSACARGRRTPRAGCCASPMS